MHTAHLVGRTAFLLKQQATGLKKCMHSTYSPLSSTHLWLRCSNFFNSSKKNSFGCAANKKIGNRERQRLISTSVYMQELQMQVKVPYKCLFAV
jgi:hypothetical protein